MNRGARRWLVLIGALAGLIAFLYWHRYRPDSIHQKLALTDRIYQELDHPAWSTRLVRAKGHRPNYGSGDYRMLVLVDVRRVSVPLSNAISFYDREGVRLGFKEFHVESSADARRFGGEWRDLRVQIPAGEDIVVLYQIFPDNDGNVRRHAPIPSP